MSHIFLSLCLLSVSLPGTDLKRPGIHVIVYVGTPCRPVQYAHVQIPELQRHARTNHDGRVWMADLSHGTHRLVVWVVGSPPISTPVVITEGQDEIGFVVDIESRRISRLSNRTTGVLGRLMTNAQKEK